MQKVWGAQVGAALENQVGREEGVRVGEGMGRIGGEDKGERWL